MFKEGRYFFYRARRERDERERERESEREGEGEMHDLLAVIGPGIRVENLY